jgi:hypothetical protein
MRHSTIISTAYQEKSFTGVKNKIMYQFPLTFSETNEKSNFKSASHLEQFNFPS